MAKVRQTILAIEGKIAGGVIYQVGSGKHKQLIYRAKRGSITPAVLNAACEKSKNDLQIANGYASCLHKALAPFSANIDTSRLWLNLQKHVRAQMKLTGIPTLASYKNFEIARGQDLSGILSITHAANVEWLTSKVTVEIVRHASTYFNARTSIDGFRTTFVALFFDAPNHLIDYQAVALKDRTVHDSLVGEKVTMIIPPETKTIVLVMKCGGLIRGAESARKDANGISIMDVFDRGNVMPT